MTEATALQVAPQRQSLVTKFAARYGIDAAKLLEALKETAFKSKDKDGRVIAISNEQMVALLVVADQYKLNPFTKEIYAFPDKRGGIVPVVSVDGWARIVNEHPQFDGMTFDWPNDDGSCCECTIYRKDREHATRVPEYLAECKRNTEPWGSHPRRMLRHKAFIQCARMAFGFAGIYDPDEAKRIEQGGYIDNDTGEIIDAKRSAGLATVRSEASAKRAKEKPAPEVLEDRPAPEEAPAEPAPEPVKATKAKAKAAAPAEPAKSADDPSAGAAAGISRGDLIRRLSWIERAKSKDDAQIVLDEVRDEADPSQIADMVLAIQKRWPE